MKEKEKFDNDETIKTANIFKDKKKKWGKIFKAKVSLKKNIKIEERQDNCSHQNEAQPLGF